jgi:hypothetical protein
MLMGAVVFGDGWQNKEVRVTAFRKGFIGSFGGFGWIGCKVPRFFYFPSELA